MGARLAVDSAVTWTGERLPDGAPLKLTGAEGPRTVGSGAVAGALSEAAVAFDFTIGAGLVAGANVVSVSVRCDCALTNSGAAKSSIAQSM